MRLLGALVSTKALAVGFGGWVIWEAGQIVIDKLDAVTTALSGAGL